MGGDVTGRQKMPKFWLCSLALCVSLFASSRAMSWDERVIFEHGLICRSIQPVLSVQDAFLRSDEAGWMRVAIEHGRAHRFLSYGEALQSHVCIIGEHVRGTVLNTIEIAGTTVYVYSQNFAVPPTHTKPLQFLKLGPFYGLELLGTMPSFRGPRLIDKEIGELVLLAAR